MTALLDRRAEAGRLTTLNPLPIDRACPELATPSTGAHDPRPQAHGRDPCPKCEIRGDLGCAHFAPCEAAPAPERQPAEFRQYNTTIDGTTRLAIAAARREGQTYRDLADRFQVSRGAVANIVLSSGLRVRRARER